MMTSRPGMPIPAEFAQGHASWRHRRKRSGLAGVFGLALAASVMFLSGCAQHQGTVSQEVWTTRGRSVITDPTLADQPPQLTAANLHTTTRTAEALRSTAVDLLMQATESRNPLLRANAMEALHHAPEYLPPIVRRGILDQNRGVRFVAAMTIGRFRLEDEGRLLEPLLRDPSESVQAAALYGMKRCGFRVDLNPLANFIVSEHPEVRGNTALVLGELGDSTALGLLRAAAGAAMPRVSPARVRLIDLQMAEAMIKLGDMQQLEVTRAALFTPAEQGEITALACQISGRVRDERVAGHLYNLAVRDGRQQQPAEIRMTATMALANIDPSRAPIEVPVMYVQSEQPELRAQAALTLGTIGGQEAMEIVAGMLTDANPMVQVAAAGAFLQASRQRMYARP